MFCFVSVGILNKMPISFQKCAKRAIYIRIYFALKKIRKKITIFINFNQNIYTKINVRPTTKWQIGLKRTNKQKTKTTFVFNFQYELRRNVDEIFQNALASGYPKAVRLNFYKLPMPYIFGVFSVWCGKVTLCQ